MYILFVISPRKILRTVSLVAPSQFAFAMFDRIQGGVFGANGYNADERDFLASVFDDNFMDLGLANEGVMKGFPLIGTVILHVASSIVKEKPNGTFALDI